MEPSRSSVRSIGVTSRSRIPPPVSRLASRVSGFRRARNRRRGRRAIENPCDGHEGARQLGAGPTGAAVSRASEQTHGEWAGGYRNSPLDLALQKKNGGGPAPAAAESRRE